MRKPNFFIIGAPKCGTTALAQYLSEHPMAFVSNPKEPHYFCTDFGYETYKNINDYFRLFDKARPCELALGEASATYLYSREAIPYLLEKTDFQRFIVMLRNPVEMAPSLHSQLCFDGQENIPDFYEAWLAQDDRAQGLKIPKGCKEPKFLQYRSACALGKQVEQLLGYVDREQVLFVFLEDLKRDPKAVWMQVQEFLRIKSDGRSAFPVVNEAKEWRSKLLSHLVLNLNKSYRTTLHLTGMRPFGTGVINQLMRAGTKKRAVPLLSPELNEILINEFSDDVRLLGKLVGRDLEHWLILPSRVS